MRVLHTSDWHLGHTFCDRSRADEQAFFLRWLRSTIEENDIDALVVAGDIFDTTNPPAEALSAYYGFLASLNPMGLARPSGRKLRAIVVGGNHDSPARLTAPRDILDAIDVTVVGGHDPARESVFLGDAAGVLVPLKGPSGEVELVVAAVPFLHDSSLGVRGLDGAEDEVRAQMARAFREVYTRLADKAQAAFPGVPIMATGHLTCLASEGAFPTEEDAVPRPIHRVGSIGALGPGVFDERLRYVALGHIHRGFAVDAAGRVHYSGTPVQVSTVEGAGSRRVLRVDIDEKPLKLHSINVPQRRRLVRIAGSLDEVIASLRGTGAKGDELPPYVTAEVGLVSPNPRAEEQVFQAAERMGAGGAQVLAVRTRVVHRADASPVASPTADTRDLSPEEAFLFAWRLKYPDATPSPQILQRFRSLLDGVHPPAELSK